MLKISVVINTYNADKYLERVLKSVENYDEIVICDMYSKDETLAIANKYNCRIVMHEKADIVEPARAYAISQARNEWVLLIDADEVVQKNLIGYLDEAVAKQADLAGVYIPRKNYMFGRFVRASYPNHLLRFFKRDSIQWPKTIHAHPIIDGRTFKIAPKREDLAFIHLANESMSQTLIKTDRYTNLELERRMRKNYGYGALIFEPMFHFFKIYIIKGGIWGGIPGLVWAVQAGYYKYLTIAKVIEAKIKPEEDYDKDLLQ